MDTLIEQHRSSRIEALRNGASRASALRAFIVSYYRDAAGFVVESCP